MVPPFADLGVSLIGHSEQSEESLRKKETGTTKRDSSLRRTTFRMTFMQAQLFISPAKYLPPRHALDH